MHAMKLAAIQTYEYIVIVYETLANPDKHSKWPGYLLTRKASVINFPTAAKLYYMLGIWL